MPSDTPQPVSRFPAAFWIGLGVPLLIVLTGLVQWGRAPSAGQGGALLLAALAPRVTLLLGALATATFTAALWAMRRAAASAMQSRDALLRAFEAARRWLPAFMTLQTLLIFGGVIGALLFEIIGAGPSRNAGRLATLGALIALALLWYGVMVVRDTLRMARRGQDIEPIQIMGQALSAEQAPLLWDFVRDVARQADARLPDSVVVGLNEGFFVTEHPVALANGQRVPEGRVLYLPLPYMAFLDRAEVAAVVAHELGHFSGDDTAYGRRFTPIYRAMVASILAITNEHAEDDGWRAWATAPASLYGKWFLATFDEAVHRWSREREFAADAFSRRVAGADPAARALLRIAVLHGLVEEALWQNRAAPPDKREGVLTLVRRFVAEHGLADPREHLEDRQTHPLDTHPTLKQRLDAFGVTLTPELAARTRDTHPARLLTELGLEAAPAAG
jgi:Zn-dependent protease with chaperone function